MQLCLQSADNVLLLLPSYARIYMYRSKRITVAIATTEEEGGG